jgi:phosphoinositide-3-kinase regulatory subunit 4
LSDFAPFKPVHLPLDDPWAFNYFFDSSARRTCYLAPERFVPTPASANAELTEAMDVFSTGCVLAEMFCDGVPPFSLSQLFSYRKGEYKSELESYLKQIEDPDMMRMIATMLSLDPVARLTAAEHLNNPTFPSFFLSMHEFLDNLANHLEPAHVSATPRPPQPATSKTAGSLNPILPESLIRPEPTLKTNADERIDRLVQSWDTAVSFLERRAEELETSNEVLTDEAVRSPKLAS